MTNTRTQALTNARQQAATGAKFAAGMCLQKVRQLYGIPALNPDAISCWRGSGHQHRTTDLLSIPAGVPVFWEGGKHGHIAIKAGGRTHDVWTTDFARNGHFDRVDGRKIGPRWGMRLLGWTEDVNGVRVYTPPPAKPKPKPKPPAAANRVTRARAYGRQMMAELDGTPAERTECHAAAADLRQLLDRLPPR